MPRRRGCDSGEPRMPDSIEYRMQSRRTLGRRRGARMIGMTLSTCLPPLFVSHGSPITALEPREAGAFLQRLGPTIDATFGRPRAILALSAHTATSMPVLLAAPRHEAVYDFGGFDPRL